MASAHNAEFTEYVQARMTSLRRVAFLLCQDWDQADDLVQGAITKLYVHWRRALAADHIDGYARAILVREFLSERRTAWARRVTVSGFVPDQPAVAGDREALMDLRTAMAALPSRQRATLVRRYHCDLNVDQSAQVLGCSPGTVKSQTVKGIATLRRLLLPADQPAPCELTRPPVLSPPDAGADELATGSVPGAARTGAGHG